MPSLSKRFRTRLSKTFKRTLSEATAPAQSHRPRRGLRWKRSKKHILRPVPTPAALPDESNEAAESCSVDAEPFPQLAFVQDAEDMSTRTQITQEAAFDENIEASQHTQHYDAGSSPDFPNFSSVAGHGFVADISPQLKSLNIAKTSRLKAVSQNSTWEDEIVPEMARNSISDHITNKEIAPKANNLNENMPEASDSSSSVYPDDKEVEFMNPDPNPILDYTVADSQLSAEQTADIQANMGRWRSDLDLEDEGLEASMSRSEDEDNNLSADRARRYPTPEIDDSGNGRLYLMPSCVTTSLAPSINDQLEEVDLSLPQTTTPSINDTEVSSVKTRSISSYFSARTSASDPFKAPEYEGSSSQLSTLSSPSNPGDSSSSLSLPSPFSNHSFPTRQSKPMRSPETLKDGRQPFTLNHLIEMEEFCKNRDVGLQMGAKWVELLWSFDVLQRSFKGKYGWEPEIERFEAFEEKRKENADFWILWDYPTNLI